MAGRQEAYELGQPRGCKFRRLATQRSISRSWTGNFDTGLFVPQPTHLMLDPFYFIFFSRDMTYSKLRKKTKTAITFPKKKK